MIDVASVRSSVWQSIFTCAALFIAQSPIQAATVINRSDIELVRTADRVVRGRVVGVRPEESPDGVIHTWSSIEILEDFTGAKDRFIEVRELGGAIGSRFLRVDGAATYQPGSEVLVLLERGANGRFRSMAMGMSKFDVLPGTGGDSVLIRNMRGISVTNGAPRFGNLMRLSTFRALARTVRGVEAVRHLSSSTTPTGDVGFTLLRFENGLGARWTEADAGIPVRWFRDASAPAPLTSAGDGTLEIQTALAAWTRPADASIQLAYAGQTEQNPNGPWPALGRGTGVIFFEDPNDEIAGNVIAIGGGGGTFNDGGTVNGVTFNRFTHGFVIFQNALALEANYRQPHDFTRIMQHEIGHGIGLGHTADTTTSAAEVNIMYPSCCSARTPVAPALGPDDLAGLVYIYPAAPCSYEVSPDVTYVPSSGGVVTASVTTRAGCQWSVTGVPAWLTSGDGGIPHVGSGVVSLVASTNPLVRSRSATILMAGRPFDVVQVPGVGPSRTPSDFNGDNRLDLLWHHEGDGTIGVWLMNGSTLLDGFGVAAVADTGWKLAGAGDLDGDGQSDFVWRHADGSLAAWLMDGMTIRRGEALSIPRIEDPRWQIRSVGDLDGNGKADIIWQHESEHALAVWSMDGFRVVEGSALNPAQVPTGWRLAASADFNRDGRRDLLWQHRVDGRIAVWFMDGSSQMSGTLTSPAAVPDLTWRIAGAGDMNGDDQPDIIWENTADGRLSVWLMAGLTLLDARPLTPSRVTDMNWHIVGPR